MPAAVVDGHDQVTGHIISTTIGGKNGEPKQVFVRLNQNRYFSLYIYLQKI